MNEKTGKEYSFNHRKKRIRGKWSFKFDNPGMRGVDDNMKREMSNKFPDS